MIRKSAACSLIATLLLLCACGNDSVSLLRTVQTLENKGDYAAAIASLKSGLGDDPLNGVLRYHLGRLYNATFDAPAAEVEFRKASELGVVEGGRVALGLGRALFQQRKYGELVADVVAAPAFEQGVLAGVHALRGHALLTLDRIAEAKRELGAATNLDVGNGDIVLMQARMQALGRDVNGAIQVVERLLARDPGNVDAWIHKADLLTVSGKPREALVALDKAIEIQPRHLNALVGRAIVLVQIDRLSDAQKNVETLRTAYPKVQVLGYLRGQIHYWRGEYREALDMAQGTLRTNQEDGPARLLSGMASLMLDAPVRAEHELARYTALHPRNVLARRVLMDLRTQIRQKGAEVKAIGSVHADELRNASVQALFGDAYIRVWQHSHVADWFERVAALGPPDPILSVKQAQRRFSSDQLDEAALDLERIVSLRNESKSADAQSADAALVLVQLARKDTAKAMDAASAMERTWPTSAQAATLAGIVLLERNWLGEAERRLDAALQRDPKLIAAVVSRARLDIVAGRADLARTRFDDALKADPDNLQALVIYAHLLETQRKRSDALGLLDRAMKAHPKALEPRVLLADMLKRENAKDRALAVAEETLASHPDEPIAIEQAAVIQLWNGDEKRGLATLERLVRVLPGSPESYFKLARAQFKAGLKAKAEANLERALALPVDEPQTEWLQLLGVADDADTLEAIESARKSYVARRSTASRSQVERELWSSPIGGPTLYEALSGGAGK